MRRTKIGKSSSDYRLEGEEKFLLGLHTFNQLSMIVDETHASPAKPQHRNLSSLCEIYVNSLPAVTCRAMRYTTLLLVKMIKANDYNYHLLRIDLNMQSVPGNLFTNKTIKIAIERDPLFIMSSCALAAVAMGDLQKSGEMSRVNAYCESVRKCLKEVHDEGLTSATSLPRFGGYLTRRICEDIRGQWPHLFENDVQAIESLRDHAARDTEGVRSLIRSFLDDFEE